MSSYSYRRPGSQNTATAERAERRAKMKLFSVNGPRPTPATSKAMERFLRKISTTRAANYRSHRRTRAEESVTERALWLKGNTLAVATSYGDTFYPMDTYRY